MAFLLLCEDKPDSLDLRLATREAHLAWARTTDMTVIMAGPLLAEDQQTMIGSLFILDAPDRAAVEAFNQEDPYMRAGLFGRVQIHEFKKLLPSP